MISNVKNSYYFLILENEFLILENGFVKSEIHFLILENEFPMLKKMNF